MKKNILFQSKWANDTNFSISTESTQCWFFELSPLTITLNEELVLADSNPAESVLSNLKNLLKEVFANRLELDETIGDDIGYLFSLDMHKDIDHRLKYEASGSYSEWIGRKYLLGWGENSISWLYTVNDCIYLEVTPFYECNHDEDESEDKKNCIQHQEFIKNYKSIARYKIPREDAQQLLRATQGLIDLIAANENRSLRNRPAHEASELQKLAIPISYKAGVTKKLIAQEGYPPYHRFVLFQLCENNEYHSFSKGKWEELDSEEQLMFINFGLTDAKGNYLL